MDVFASTTHAWGVASLTLPGWDGRRFNRAAAPAKGQRAACTGLPGVERNFLPVPRLCGAMLSWVR